MDPRITDNRIRLVKNDTGPQVQLTLTDDATGSPVNLSGATATLHLKSLATGATVLSRAMTIPPSTASQGVAVVVWSSGDLNQSPGDYDGEVEVVFSTGMRQTVYDVLKFRIRDEFA